MSKLCQGGEQDLRGVNVETCHRATHGGPVRRDVLSRAVPGLVCGARLGGWKSDSGGETAHYPPSQTWRPLNAPSGFISSSCSVLVILVNSPLTRIPGFSTTLGNLQVSI